ncbi:MAG TPA: ribose 5-phosphate isomerase B [Polyangiales bacterium]
MRIALGSDHAGFRYKEEIARMLRELGHEVRDLGAFDEQPTDYPDWIRPVAMAVASGEVERGIVLGGSGNGEAMVANRVRGVRCGLCWSVESARSARAHDDANCLALGQRTISLELALEIVRTFLATPFEGGRHLARVRKIDS